MSISTDRQALLIVSKTGFILYPGPVFDTRSVTTVDTQICEEKEAIFHSPITGCEKYFLLNWILGSYDRAVSKFYAYPLLVHLFHITRVFQGKFLRSS